MSEELQPNLQHVAPTPEEIRAARKALGVTQEEAGHMVKVSRRTWQAWEHGVTPMTPGLWLLFRLKLKDSLPVDSMAWPVELQE